MNRSLTIVPFFALAAVAAVACSSSSTDSTATTPTGDAGTTTPDAATSGGDGGARVLSFTPSNIDLSGIDLSNIGDFVVDRANCQILSTQNQVECGDATKIAFGVVDQPNGGGKIGVYVARTIRVEPNASLIADQNGTYPIAIVALDTFDVEGSIDVSAHKGYPSAGGFVHVNTYDTKGGGPGGGGAGSHTNGGGGGGGYCGVGGQGSAYTGGAGAAGGVSYGSAAIIPLVGGSAGGNEALYDSGTGGGAIQLVAGTSFTLGANATIAAGGGGGASGGVPSTQQHGAGGGSGGAILIEAPTASILGTLIANGGAGGSAGDGQDAPLDGTQATSTAQPGGANGGVGSVAVTVNGGAGTWTALPDNGSGGGGAAGRIRINTTAGNSSLSAKLISPSPNTPCATEGTLASR